MGYFIFISNLNNSIHYWLLFLYHIQYVPVQYFSKPQLVRDIQNLVVLFCGASLISKIKTTLSITKNYMLCCSWDVVSTQSLLCFYNPNTLNIILDMGVMACSFKSVWRCWFRSWITPLSSYFSTHKLAVICSVPTFV